MTCITFLNERFDIYTRSLLLHNTQSSNIPAEIGNFINLKRLYIVYNKFSSLPTTIGNLINLQEIYLNFNLLSTLPAEIDNFINLKNYNYSITNYTV